MAIGRRAGGDDAPALPVRMPSHGFKRANDGRLGNPSAEPTFEPRGPSLRLIGKRGAGADGCGDGLAGKKGIPCRPTDLRWVRLAWRLASSDNLFSRSGSEVQGKPDRRPLPPREPPGRSGHVRSPWVWARRPHGRLTAAEDSPGEPSAIHGGGDPQSPAIVDPSGTPPWFPTSPTPRRRVRAGLPGKRSRRAAGAVGAGAGRPCPGCFNPVASGAKEDGRANTLLSGGPGPFLVRRDGVRSGHELAGPHHR